MYIPDIRCDNNGFVGCVAFFLSVVFIQSAVFSIPTAVMCVWLVFFSLSPSLIASFALRCKRDDDCQRWRPFVRFIDAAIPDTHLLLFIFRRCVQFFCCCCCCIQWTHFNEFPFIQFIFKWISCLAWDWFFFFLFFFIVLTLSIIRNYYKFDAFNSIN